MSGGGASALNARVRLQAEATAAAIERACEAALQDGRYGVMWDGKAAWVDPSVPYGHIHDVSRTRE